MCVFIVFIYLQAVFVIKGQISLDFKEFNWIYSQCSSNVNAYELMYGEYVCYACTK